MILFARSFSNFYFYFHCIVQLVHRHPVKMLLSLWMCPPPLTECRVLSTQLLAALVNARQCRSRLRSSSLQVVEQQFDPEVRFHCCFLF